MQVNKSKLLLGVPIEKKRIKPNLKHFFFYALNHFSDLRIPHLHESDFLNG